MDNSKKQRNQSSDPSDATPNTNIPRIGNEDQKREGDYRDAETQVNQTENFDDAGKSRVKDNRAREDASDANDDQKLKS